MSSTELNGWEEYFTVYPFSDEAADTRVALLCAMMLNVRRTKSSDKIWTPKDFIPRYLEEPSKSIDRQRAEFATFKARYISAVKEAQS